MSDLWLPNSHLAAQALRAAAQISAEAAAVERAMQDHDPDLRLIHNQHEDRFEVRRVNHRRAGKLQYIFTVENPDGSFRAPDGRDVTFIKRADLQAPGAMGQHTLDVARARREKQRETERAEASAEMADELHSILRRHGQVLAPRASMHVSDRERRKAGTVTA